MSGLRTAGFDLVIGFGEGPLAEIINNSPLGLPINLGEPPNEISFSAPSGIVGVSLVVERPSAVTFDQGQPPLALTCPVSVRLIRAGQFETNDFTVRLVVLPALNAAGDQAVLRLDPAASEFRSVPSPPALPPTVTPTDFDTVLNGFVFPQIVQLFIDPPLTVPVPLVSPADGTQVEQLGAGLTSQGITAVLAGVRTGATHTEPAGELAIPSFLDHPAQVGALVRGGWLLEQSIGPGLRRESFPNAEITYFAAAEELRATAPPFIFQEGNLRVTSLTVRIDGPAEVIRLEGEYRDSGFGFTASGTFSTSIHCLVIGTELEITVDPVEIEYDTDLAWWVVLINFIVAYGLLGLSEAILLAALGFLSEHSFFLTIELNPGKFGARGALDTALEPLRDVGSLDFPLPGAVQGLVLENCKIDDAVFLGRLRFRDAAPVRAEGSVVLGRGMLLDLDTGSVFRSGETLLLPGAPVPRHDLQIPGGGFVIGGRVSIGGLRPGGAEEPASVGELRTLDPARIAVTPEPFEDLTVFDLLDLNYVWTFLPPTVGSIGESVVASTEAAGPGAPGGEPPPPAAGRLGVGRGLTSGLLVAVGPGPFQTFAVRTSDGLYAKCRARNEDDGVRIEYRTYEDVTARSVGIGGHAVVTETRRVDPAVVELAHRATFSVEPVNLTHPLAATWTLAGQTLSAGSAVVTVSGVPVDVEVTNTTLVLRTALGANIDADLAVTVTDATGHTVSATRRIKLPGRRFEFPAPIGPLGPTVTTGARELVLTMAGANDVVSLRLPAGMARAIRRPTTVTLRPAADVLREALAKSGYDLKSDYDLL